MRAPVPNANHDREAPDFEARFPDQAIAARRYGRNPASNASNTAQAFPSTCARSARPTPAASPNTAVITATAAAPAYATSYAFPASIPPIATACIPASRARANNSSGARTAPGFHRRHEHASKRDVVGDAPQRLRALDRAVERHAEDRLCVESGAYRRRVGVFAPAMQALCIHHVVAGRPEPESGAQLTSGTAIGCRT